jgi:hypothetical protein
MSFPRHARRLAALAFLLACLASPAYAQSYGDVVNAAFVRTHFKMKDGEDVKFEEFKTKTFPTATVVWGQPEKNDKARLAAGVAPSGSKLMVVFAELKNEKEFERILSTYKDGEAVQGVGRRAIWSAKWKQLSVLLSPKLAIHVHLDHPGVEDLKATLVALAKDIAKRLR